jgi:hypothetical protein
MVLDRAGVCVRGRRTDAADVAVSRPRAAMRSVVSVAAVGLVVLVAGCTSHAPHHSATSSAAGPTPSSPTAAVRPAASPTPSTTASAPKTKSGGGIDETVPARTLVTAKPVATNQTASFGNSVSAHISALKHINAVAHGIGEVSGPAVAVTFVIKNGTGHTIDLGSVSVNVQDAAGTPANTMSGSPAQPFAGTLAAGKSSSGTYVFSLPKGHPNPITISLSYTTEAPVVLFVGDTA